MKLNNFPNGYRNFITDFLFISFVYYLVSLLIFPCMFKKLVLCHIYYKYFLFVISLFYLWNMYEYFHIEVYEIFYTYSNLLSFFFMSFKFPLLLRKVYFIPRNEIFSIFSYFVFFFFLEAYNFDLSRIYLDLRGEVASFFSWPFFIAGFSNTTYWIIRLSTH